MRCIIIDDEELSRKILEKKLRVFPELELVGTFSSAIAAMKFLNKNTVDLVFLDIHMPDFSGFDFMQTIKNPPMVVLVTGDQNFSLVAFEYECVVDYLVKPIENERFSKAISKVLKKGKNTEIPPSTKPIDSKAEDNAKEFYVNIDRRLVKIEFQSVSVVEAQGDYILIKTDKQNYLVHSTLKKIEEKLPNDIFIKIHRSYIVNFTKIIDIEDNSVLIGKEVFPLSRTYRPNLIKKLNLL